MRELDVRAAVRNADTENSYGRFMHDLVAAHDRAEKGEEQYRFGGSQQHAPSPGELQQLVGADPRGQRVEAEWAIERFSKKRIYYFQFAHLVDVLFSIVVSNAIAQGNIESHLGISSVTSRDHYLKQIDKFKLVLGNIEIRYADALPLGEHMLDDSYLVVNLGQVPISMEFFQSWMIANIVKPERKSYNFMEFIRDFIDDAIVGILNDSDCWGKSLFRDPVAFKSSQSYPAARGLAGAELRKLQAQQWPSVHSTMATGAPRLVYDGDQIREVEIFDYLRGDDASGENVFNLPSNEQLHLAAQRGEELDAQTGGRSEMWTATHAGRVIDTGYPIIKSGTPEYSYQTMYEYAIFYMPQIKSGRTGDFHDDAKSGIYHYSVGSNKGIVKDIKFKKAKGKGLREARIEAVGTSADSMHTLLDRYDVEIELIGTPKLIPGNSIYIDPKGFSPMLGDPWQGPSSDSEYWKKSGNQDHDKSGLEGASPAWIMGIGGYYMITDVSSKIEPGAFTTKITAMWTDAGEVFMDPGSPEKEKTMIQDCNKERVEEIIMEAGAKTASGQYIPYLSRGDELDTGRNAETHPQEGEKSSYLAVGSIENIVENRKK